MDKIVKVAGFVDIIIIRKEKKEEEEGGGAGEDCLCVGGVVGVLRTCYSVIK